MRKLIVLSLLASMALLSCGESKKDAQEYLLSKGIIKSVKEIKGKRVSQLFFDAVDNHDWDLAERICIAGMNMNTYCKGRGHVSVIQPLAYVAYIGNTDMIELLLKHGDKGKKFAEQKSSALYYAAWHGNIDCLKLLLDAGVDTESKGRALGGAADGGYADCIELLLDEGADKATGATGAALIQAAGHDSYDCPECVNLLLDAGADVNYAEPQPPFGGVWTPLTNAVFWNNVKIAKILIDAGANVNVVDYCGLTPLMRAQSKKSPEMIRILREAGARE